MRRPVFWWIAVVTLVLVAIPIVARIAQQEAGPLAYAVAFMPWVLAACFVPLVFSLIARDGWLAMAAFAMIALCLWWQAPLFTTDGGADPQLRVASVNATFGEVDPAAVVQMVQDRQVDILAIQELTPAAATALTAAGLDDELTFSLTQPADGFAGIGLWSRFPMTAEPLTGFTGKAITGVVEAPFGDMTVDAVHPAAPGLIDHTLWSQDLAHLATVMSDHIGPTLVLGDLNATRDHSGFRLLERLGYDDAADQAGSGFAMTFPEQRTPWPLVAIDHALVRDTALTALQLKTVVLKGSDHRAIVVQYGFPSE
jgi:endonuclease/exonuclease/phosphatase (EEP) superfamily protein YafD